MLEHGDEKMYSYQELEAQTKSQLLALIEWQGFGEISRHAKKRDIIDFILEKTYNEDVEEPPMSVRIRRIKESKKE